MGIKCVICSAPNGRDIDVALEIMGPTKTARKFGLLYQHVERHNRLHRKAEPAKSGPPLPILRPGATPLERARAQAEWLQARLKHLKENNGTSAEYDRLAAQINASNKHLARLEGAFDLTEAQVVKSAHFQRVLGFVIDALRKRPSALKAVHAALEKATKT